MQKLSAQQKACLATLQASGKRRQAFSPGMLATLLDTSKEGAAATASSLVRRGLAERAKDSGRVYYRAVSA